MYTFSKALLCAASSLSLFAGCASRYDARAIDERTRSLFQSAQAPPLDVGTGGAFPEGELAGEASLEGYVRYGLRHSARLRAAFETWRASTERVEQVSTLPEPRLSYVEFLEEIETRTGPQDRRFGVSQAFPWPGELATRADVATHRAEAAWERVEAVRLDVIRRIEEAYHAYAFLARELAITRELLDLVRGLEPVVQGRIRAGAGQAGLLRLQVEIGRLEDDLASIERRRPSLSTRLADAMHLPIASADSLPLPELRLPPPSALPPLAELVERALAASPTLRALGRELDAARAAEELATFRRRPDFAARVDTIQTGDALNPSTPGSGDDPLFLGLTVSLPIWTSSYSAAEREARHARRALRARLEDARSALNADLADEAFRVDDARRRIKLYTESLIPRAREALALTSVSYRGGGASVLELLDSERALLEFELSLWRACREYLQGEARLRALVGGDRS